MSSSQPFLILVNDSESPDSEGKAALRAAFDLHEAADLETALAMLKDNPQGRIIISANDLDTSEGGLDFVWPASVLENLGEGVGVISSGGEIRWINSPLARKPDALRKEFFACCQEAAGTFRPNEQQHEDSMPRAVRTFTFDSKRYEVEVAAIHQQGDGNTGEVVGILRDISAATRQQERIDAIDAAGRELVKLEADQIAPLNTTERLQLLEKKIVRYVQELLEFDHFEIRLLNRRTNQLELVIAVGLTPLKIGDVIYAEPEGNGISGYVASTGRSYICPNVQGDPLYREGLDDAASSLTVPLHLHDRIIGVFNVESNSPDAFDEQDRQFAEIFGRSIAIAMNTLNLLVVERYTTNERLAQEVLRELSTPVEKITELATQLREQLDNDEQMQAQVDEIIESASVIAARTRSCTAGPRSLLGVDTVTAENKPDPAFVGKRILIADDETDIRETIESVLLQKGCEITICGSGAAAIEVIRATDRQPFDLVISDVKMPDGSGYEVFRASKDISPSTPVILMTGFGYDPNHTIVRASQEGLHCFLFKPFQAKQLLDEAAKALRGHDTDSV